MLICLQQQSMWLNSLKSARGVEGVRELKPPLLARRLLLRRRLPRGAAGVSFNSLTDPTPLPDLRELNGSDCCFSLRSIIRRFRKG